MSVRFGQSKIIAQSIKIDEYLDTVRFEGRKLPELI